ncbi:hypothetical protein JVU11DRAFT_6758 [Chiua virens]|nr:hypothetical protein JVU11DRAFT_6758 [Chiua virens]
MPSRHRLQQFVIAISILSVFYNATEGVVSIVFGAESSSRALVFYGLQSAVEVVSDILVTWRFFSAIRPGSEMESRTSSKIIQIERIATIIIGFSLVSLTIAAIATSAASLAAHDYPSTTLPSIIIAASAIGITGLLYFVKRYLARALDSSALNGQALCTLCCMQLSVVLLIGSLIFRVWKGGWWADATTAIVIGLMFGWEGFKMIRWARNEEFDGGCCGDCHPQGSDKGVVALAPTCAVTLPVETEVPKAPNWEQKDSEGPPCTVTPCCGCTRKDLDGSEAIDGEQAC